MINNSPRILIGKVGLDEHEKGIIWVSKVLRDAGMEVVYLGPRQTIEGIVLTAIQESVDVIGLSFACGGHLEITQRIMDRLREHGLKDIPVIEGGNIPEQDVPRLKGMGVVEVFLPGAKSTDIVSRLLDEVNKKRSGNVSRER